MHFHLYFLYFFLAKYSKFRETDVFFIKAFCSEKISVCVTVFFHCLVVPGTGTSQFKFKSLVLLKNVVKFYFDVRSFKPCLNFQVPNSRLTRRPANCSPTKCLTAKATTAKASPSPSRPSTPASPRSKASAHSRSRSRTSTITRRCSTGKSTSRT